MPVLSCQQQRSPGAARRPNPDCGHLTEPSRCHPLPSTAAWRRTQTHGRRDHRSGSASGSPNAAGAAAGVLTIWHSSGTTPHPSPLNAHRRALAWLTGVPPDPAGSTGRITTIIHHWWGGPPGSVAAGRVGVRVGNQLPLGPLGRAAQRLTAIATYPKGPGFPPAPEFGPQTPRSVVDHADTFSADRNRAVGRRP